MQRFRFNIKREIRNIGALATVVKNQLAKCSDGGTKWDITKRKKALRQIEEAKEQAKHQQSKSEEVSC
jgi:hypothetical protein